MCALRALIFYKTSDELKMDLISYPNGGHGDPLVTVYGGSDGSRAGYKMP